MLFRSFLKKLISFNQVGVRRAHLIKYNRKYVIPYEDALEVCGSRLKYIPTLKVRPNIVFTCYLLNDPQSENLNFIAKYPPFPAEKPEWLELLQSFHDNPKEVPENLPSVIKKELRRLPFEEFLDFVHIFYVASFKPELDPKNVVLKKAKTVLEVELKGKIKQLTIDESFKLLILLYRVPRVTPSFVLLLFKLYEKINNFTKPQVLWLCFLTQKFKSLSVKHYKFNLENAILAMMPEFKIGDLALICCTFYHLMKNFSLEEIIPEIVSKTTASVDEMNSCYLTSISMMLSTTHPKKNQASIEKFQKNMFPHISKFSIPSLIRLVLTGEKMHYVNRPLMDSVLNRVMENIETVSNFFLLSLLDFCIRINYQNEKYFNAVIEKLKTVNYKEDLQSIIWFLECLVHLQIFPEDLLSKIMKKEVIESILNNNLTSTSLRWQFLYGSMEVEMPHLVPEDVDKILLKLREKKMFSLNLREKHTMRLFYFIENILEGIFGKDKYVWVGVLPHYLNLLVMKFDKNLEPQNISKDFVTKKGRIARPLPDDNYWLCITPLEFYGQTNDKGELSLVTLTKYRQLGILGYEFVSATKEEAFDWKASPDLLKGILEAKLQERSRKSQIHTV